MRATRVTDRLFVAGGFAEVTPERCTVLANEAMPLAEVNARRRRTSPGRGREYAARFLIRTTSSRRNWRWSASSRPVALIEAVEDLIGGGH